MLPATVLPGILKPFHVLADNNMLLNSMLQMGLDDRVLVVIFLNGGNDGLNTVIPLDQYGNLSAVRQNILINQSKALTLNGYNNVGLHPAMQGMRNLFNDNKLQIIQSVGYPNPNFSHFRSTDIWTSASDSDQVISTGWIGRFLDGQYPGFPSGYPNTAMPDPLSIQIGASLPLMYQSNSANLSMVVNSPAIFNNTFDEQQNPAPQTPAGDELTYLRLIASQTKSYAKAIIGAYSKVTSQYSGYPVQGKNPLADIMKVIARLIKGGLKTKVYSVSLGGFDTHSAQVDGSAPESGAHAALLGILSEAVTAFQADMEFLGLNQRVLGMTFSEFGRRIRSNASLGTDHGAAGPLFLFGSSVKGGILGNNPVIPKTVTSSDNLPMQYDFRNVYASVLKDWFCLDQNEVDAIMLKNYASLPILKNTCSSQVDIMKIEDLMGLQAYPNPFYDYLDINYRGVAGNISLSLFDALGRRVQVIENHSQQINADYNVRINTLHLEDGNYYLRVENGPAQKALLVTKISG